MGPLAASVTGPGASMRWVGRIATTVVLVAVLSTAAWRVLAGSDQSGPEQARFLLFSTTDLWRQGGFAHGGLLWSPFGLDQEGPVLKLMLGGGVYHYVSGALGNVDVRGQQLAGAALPGWRFIRNGFIVTAFLGYDFQRHQLSPDDLSAGLRGDYVAQRIESSG